MKALPLKVIFAYLVVYIVWGTTYYFIKLTVATVPPYYLVGLRFSIAGTAFLLFALANGSLRHRPRLPHLVSALFLGVFLLMGGNGLVSVAQRSVDSYLAALVIAATPFAVAIFDWLLFRKVLRWSVFIGIACGTLGVALVLYNGHDIRSSFTPGIWLVIAGFSAWALATSAGHRLPVHPNTLVNSGLQMFGAGVLSLALSAVMYGPPAQVFAGITVQSWLALGYLTIPGAIAFYCYSYLIRHEPSIRVVSYAFVNPLIALGVGLAVAGEKPTPLLGLGLPLVLAGLGLMFYGPLVRRSRPHHPVR